MSSTEFSATVLAGTRGVLRHRTMASSSAGCNGRTTAIASSRAAARSTHGTADTDFACMQRHGIDGVFLQRLGCEINVPGALEHVLAVLRLARYAAARHGRLWAMMYDLSGMRSGDMLLLLDDWAELWRLGLGAGQPGYLTHRGRPVARCGGRFQRRTRRHNRRLPCAVPEFPRARSRRHGRRAHRLAHSIATPSRTRRCLGLPRRTTSSAHGPPAATTISRVDGVCDDANARWHRVVWRP
jgi:hypothetical protein